MNANNRSVNPASIRTPRATNAQPFCAVHCRVEDRDLWFVSLKGDTFLPVTADPRAASRADVAEIFALALGGTLPIHWGRDVFYSHIFAPYERVFFACADGVSTEEERLTAR